MALYQGKKKIPPEIKKQRNQLITTKLSKQLKSYHKKLANFLKQISDK